MNEHKFTSATFDVYVKEALLLFNKGLTEANESQDWTLYVNVCSSIVSFINVFEERLKDFNCIIPDLITVIKEKTELARKNSAILLAKLAKEEENNKMMREHHGHEVLVSLKDCL